MTYFVFPFLLEIDTVAVLKLDRLHRLAGLGLQELNLSVFRQVTLYHPCQQIRSTVVQCFYAHLEFASTGDTSHLALYISSLTKLIRYHQDLSVLVTIDLHRYRCFCHSLMILKNCFLFVRDYVLVWCRALVWLRRFGTTSLFDVVNCFKPTDFVRQTKPAGLKQGLRPKLKLCSTHLLR